ncbi:MAG: UDP-N-acetylmuramate dehydrogenase [Saccharospirillum sp.]|nr:UDP-N-acetylmuramate dehydrogenase [Saccharospirillum sp.]
MTPTVSQKVPLGALNSLGVSATASHFVEVTERAQLQPAIDWAHQHELDVRVLGGGSNLVLAQTVHALVLAMRLPGREQRAVYDNGDELWRFNAGETWHDTVVFTVEQGLCGLENLALIPGLVGAAPVQNIGAYGVELSDHLVGVEVYDCQLKGWRYLHTADCRLSYRDSLFKQEEGRFVITAIDLLLSRIFSPRLDYGPLKSLAGQSGLTAQQVMEEVIATRQSRLPDPTELPNAGSFFKNPLVDTATRERIMTEWPNLVSFAQEDGLWKLAAGWLIEQAGLKGKHNAQGVGCYEKQALVLVNPLRAGTAAILDWQHHVQARVEDTFGVQLEPEPRFWR